MMAIAGNVLVKVTNDDLDENGNFNCPENIMVIGMNAFSGCTRLIQIYLPQSITEIRGWAFSGCCSLTHITLPQSLIVIGEHPFYGCLSLTQVNLPESLAVIGTNAFSMCSGIIEMKLPQGITEIGSWAFSDCSSLTQINLPQSITKIGYEAFNGCNNLKDIIIEGQDFARIYNLLPQNLQQIVKKPCIAWMLNSSEVVKLKVNTSELIHDVSNHVNDYLAPLSIVNFKFFKEKNQFSLYQGIQKEEKNLFFSSNA